MLPRGHSQLGPFFVPYFTCFFFPSSLLLLHFPLFLYLFYLDFILTNMWFLLLWRYSHATPSCLILLVFFFPSSLFLFYLDFMLANLCFLLLWRYNHAGPLLRAVFYLFSSFLLPFSSSMSFSSSCTLILYLLICFSSYCGSIHIKQDMNLSLSIWLSLSPLVSLNLDSIRRQ